VLLKKKADRTLLFSPLICRFENRATQAQQLVVVVVLEST